jgi:formylaminopyrimidine deformylase / aminopyrimidine aminohydrolase
VQVYWDAWSNVNDQLRRQGATGVDESPVQALATNWSSSEFDSFVQSLKTLTDDIYSSLDERAWKEAERIWTRVIELEKGFWPNEGEEKDSGVSA